MFGTNDQALSNRIMSGVAKRLIIEETAESLIRKEKIEALFMHLSWARVHREALPEKNGCVRTLLVLPRLDSPSSVVRIIDVLRTTPFMITELIEDKKPDPE